MRELLPMTQAAERVGVTLPTFRRLVRQRGIVLYDNPRDARQKLVDWADVERALQPRALDTTPAEGKAAA